MKIFILEDDKYRMKKFRRELIGHEIDHSKTVEGGTALLVAKKYDLLFLDHDLDGEEMVDSFSGNTGYKLAEFIASFTKNKDTHCIVHSCNPTGADNICRILPQAMRLPFVTLNIAAAAKWVENRG